MDKRELDPTSDTSEKSPLTATDIDTVCDYKDTSTSFHLPSDSANTENTILPRPASLSVKASTSSDLASHRFDKDRDGKSDDTLNCVESEIPNQQSEISEDTFYYCEVSDRYCALDESRTRKTKLSKNIAAESGLSSSDTSSDPNNCSSIKRGECGAKQTTLFQRLNGVDTTSTRCPVESHQKERRPESTPWLGEYCLASPINDYKDNTLVNLYDEERAIPPCRITHNSIEGARNVVSRNGLFYANLTNYLAYPPSLPSNCNSEHIHPGVHCSEKSLQSGNAACQTSKLECAPNPPRVLQTECSTCSCLGSLNNKVKSNPGTDTANSTEPSCLNGNSIPLEMENQPSTKSNMEPSGRHYYNSGSALLKPLMKRMSMLTKAGAFKNWVSSGEKAPKTVKGTEETKSSDKNLNRASASENDDANSTVTGLDLSLPPRFSQIDSCSRHPLPRLPPQQPQNSHSQLYHQDHSFGYPHYNRQHHYPQSLQSEREIFINLHHPPEERYVLNHSCSGFSLGHSLHSPNSSQLPQPYPHCYSHHHQHQQQQHHHQQWQLLSHHQQHQQQQLHHHQLTRHLSTDSLNSLLQTVRCGQNRYRISPVSLLWTFLSVLLASACALSLATPCWMVHPDHIHSFGLFNLCVRDKRFALPRPLCMRYSEMSQWGVVMPSTVASSSYPSYSSSSSNPSSYDRQIPTDFSGSSRVLRRRRSSWSHNKSKVRSSSSHTNLNAKNNNTQSTHTLGKQLDTINFDSEILPFHRSSSLSNRRKNRDFKSNEGYVQSTIGTDKNRVRAQSSRAVTSPQRSIDQRRRDYARDQESSGSGLYSIPSVAWQAACLLFGAGVGVQILGAVISIVILVVTDPLHRRLATANGFLQTAGVFLLASGLLLYPAGFGSQFYRYYCAADGAFESGRCHMGWSYVIAVMATALSVFCPVMSSFAEAQQKVKATGSSGGGGGGGGGGVYKQAANTERANGVSA